MKSINSVGNEQLYGSQASSEDFWNILKKKKKRKKNSSPYSLTNKMLLWRPWRNATFQLVPVLCGFCFILFIFSIPSKWAGASGSLRGGAQFSDSRVGPEVGIYTQTPSFTPGFSQGLGSPGHRATAGFQHSLEKGIFLPPPAHGFRASLHHEFTVNILLFWLSDWNKLIIPLFHQYYVRVTVDLEIPFQVFM